jgi:hypothetical protein
VARLINSSPHILENPEIEEMNSGFGHWIVTVYNNDTNTYEEVITILMIATSCDLDEASIETWEIDNLGRSVVHHGQEEQCREAADIIAQIGIRVEVSEE